MPTQFKLPLNTHSTRIQQQEAQEDALFCATRLIYRCACSFFSIIFGLPVMFCLLRVCVETHTLGLFIQMRLGTNEKSCECCLEKHLRVRSKCHRK